MSVYLAQGLAYYILAEVVIAESAIEERAGYHFW